MSDTNNNNDQSSVSAFDGNEEQNSSTDRIAATLRAIVTTECEVEDVQKKINPIQVQLDAEIKAESVLKTKIQLLVEKERELRDKKEMLLEKELKLRVKKEKLLKDLKNGEYFAKADDIFPRDQFVLVHRQGFRGAADMMMRERAPVADADDNSNGDFNPYEDLIKAFEKHLQEDSNDPDASVADMESVAASDASGSLTDGGKLARATSRSTAGDNNEKARFKRSVIPSKGGHRGHQIPDGASCVPWWALVCQWTIGKVDTVETLYKKIEEQEDPEERRKMEDRLRRALVLLATGTAGKNGGMKDVPQNILYVPNPHAEYYDTGYNWVIIPIMTLEQIKTWKGEPFEFAIFTGDNAKDMEKKKKEENHNHFKDGPTQHSAVEAEKEVFAGLEPKNIKVCSKEDLGKVTDVLTNFLKAFADLHTRSFNGDGEPKKHVSPRKWSIIDLADEVKRIFQAAITKKGQDPTNNTKIVSVDQSKCGIEALIKELLKKPSGHNEDPGVRTPKHPLGNTFDGKHVFKAPIRQAYPPDPLLVAGKGANNFGRQWGIRFMSGCTDESDLDSSSDMNPPMVFTGLELAVATPDQLRPCRLAVTTDSDDYDDAIRDVSFDEDFTGLDPAVVTPEK